MRRLTTRPEKASFAIIFSSRSADLLIKPSVLTSLGYKGDSVMFTPASLALSTDEAMRFNDDEGMSPARSAHSVVKPLLFVHSRTQSAKQCKRKSGMTEPRMHPKSRICYRIVAASQQTQNIRLHCFTITSWAILACHIQAVLKWLPAA
jgi:hypothetical protein